jgi:hypothetical protein
MQNVVQQVMKNLNQITDKKILDLMSIFLEFKAKLLFAINKRKMLK